MQDSYSNRMKYIDVARGIAMLCIILGHLGINEINRFVFTFHVPIFFVISGYFINENGDLGDFVKKKIKGLILPYITTCVLIVALSVVIHIASTPDGKFGETALSWIYASFYGSGATYYEPFYIKSIGALWFLLASFWGSLLLKLILKLNKYVRAVLVAVIFLIGYFSVNLFWFPFSIQAGMCALLYMYIGYLCKSVTNFKTSFPKEVRITFVFFSFAVWIGFVISFESFWLVRGDFGKGITDILSSLCAVFCIIFISKNIVSRFLTPLANALAYIGKYSVIMLCAHIIELNLFPWNKLISVLGISEIHGIAATIVLIIGKLIWSISITYICSRKNFTRRIFGLKPVEVSQVSGDKRWLEK